MRRKCDTCGTTRFGLIRPHWLDYVFCSKVCKGSFLANRNRQIEHTKRWLGFPCSRVVSCLGGAERVWQTRVQ